MTVETIDRDEDFRRAFGGHAGICRELLAEIDQIRNNDPRCRRFFLFPPYEHRFSERAWELLGRYVANNDRLERIYLNSLDLTDETMPLLFKDLTGSASLKTLELSNNGFGLDGVRNMVPFLRNSSLTELQFDENENIDAECFRVLINALHGRSIRALIVGGCSIEDVAALSDYSLPHLKELYLFNNNIRTIPSLEKYTDLKELHLQRNNIGGEGCKSIAKLLQNQSSRLFRLDLQSNDIGDKEAEVIANSLRCNRRLKSLCLQGNNIKEDGRRAFLKLLNDVSSIDGTYNSNHTLTVLGLTDSFGPEATELDGYIAWALLINKEDQDEEDPGGAGRKKVVAFQLDSDQRMVLCRLQRMDYCYNSLFAGIPPLLLPDVLSIVAGEYGQNEIYRMLIASVTDLVSIVNKKAAIEEKIAILSKTMQVKKELVLTAPGGKVRPTGAGAKSSLSGTEE